MTFPASDKLPHDDWFYDSIPMIEDPPNSNDFDSPLPKGSYASRHESSPDHEKSAEEVVTMHEKMYRMAIARYNPFSIGGSENCDADIDCPIGGSENHVR